MAEKKRGQGEGSISKRPDGTWCGRITVGKDDNGKQKRKAFYGKTRKEVLGKMNAVKVELDKGIYIEPSSMTVAQWIDIWLKEYKKNSLKPKTYYTYCQFTELYYKPQLGEVKLKDLRGDMIQRFINYLIEKGLKASSIKRIYAPLKSALEQAVENELIMANVAVKAKLPKEVKKAARVLSIEEQKKLLETAKKSKDGELFILLLATGLRIGEAMALTWDDIDFEKGLLKVNKGVIRIKDYYGDEPFRLEVGTTKTESSNRIVPLLPDMQRMLKAVQDSQNYVEKEYKGNNLIFPNSKGNFKSFKYVGKKLDSIARKAGIEDLHPHTLRHTFATRCLENGIELKVVQDFLGHSSIKMTADLYTHVLPNKKQESIMKLQDTFNI